jgi:serine/threonine-protein kinase
MTATAQEPLPVGRFYFEELGLIGTGGLGQVDKIRITRSNASGMPVGSEWARKRLHDTWDKNTGMRDRFEREIHALKTMSHPNIVTCQGENLDGFPRFYVMPLFTDSVRKFIARGGWKNNWKAIARAGATLADALHYAHTHHVGFIHRDLKPDNILFNADGPLVIADWGLGYFIHKNSVVLVKLTRGGMGTEYYCSIEQWNTGTCDGRGDIYSLGMTLDEWVTGEQRAIIVGTGVNGDSVSPTTAGAVAFNAAIRAMTAALPQRRPASMQHVASLLRAAAAL